MLGEITFWLGVVAFGLLPGWALLRCAGLRWSTTRVLAAIPGLSLALVSLAAYGTEVVGLPVAPATVLLVLALCGAALYGLRRQMGTGYHGTETRVPREPWYCWLIFAAAATVLLVLYTLRSTLLLPPTVDDGLHHATWIRLIYELQSLNPVELFAPPVSANTPVYYPWGFHGFIALIATTTSLEPMESYWRVVLLVGSVVPLSVYSLARIVFTEKWPAVAAALLSPLFYWIPFQPYQWGGLSLLAGATCALPVVALALAASEIRSLPAQGLAALAGLGLVLIHPSQALGALWVVGTLAAVYAARRRMSWRLPALSVASVVFLAVVIVYGAEHSAPIQKFMQSAEAVGRVKHETEQSTAVWLADLYLGGGKTAPLLGLLCGVGVVVAGLRREFRPILGLHVAILMLLPAALARSWLTALWYHALERIWYLQIAAVPLLGAVGLWGAVEAVRWAADKKLHRSVPRAVAWPVALILVGGASHSYVRAVSPRLARARATMPTDPSYLEDFAWIRRHVPRGDLILNAPGDWGFVLPFTGRMLTFPNAQAARRAEGHWSAFYTLHDVGGYGEADLRALRALGVRYVYAGLFPDYDVESSPPARINLKAVELSPALEQVYASRTAHVYRVREHLKPLAGEEISLDQDSPLSFTGFFRLRRDDEGRAIRWTTGHGVARIPRQQVPEAAGCYLRLGATEPYRKPIVVSWNGHHLEPVVRGLYQLPSGLHSLKLESSTFVPRETEPGSSDSRRLGVAIRRVMLQCAATPGKTEAVNARRLPLQGGPGIEVGGFHPLEHGEGTSWRWTRGQGRMTIADELMPGGGGECALSVDFYRPPGESFVARWNGTPLEESQPGVFPLSERTEPHELAIQSEVKLVEGFSRPRGAGLHRLAFHCPQSSTP